LHNLENISGYDDDVSSFHCEDMEDGSVLLHYYYQWKDLEVIAAGFVKAVAKNVYCTSIEIEIQTVKEKKYNDNNYYVCFLVKGQIYT